MILDSISRRLNVLLFSMMIGVSSAASTEAPAIPPDWTDVEKYAWQEILAGHEVELSREVESGGVKLSAETRTEHQELSGHFLETILTEANFKEKITRFGVRVDGAWIHEPLDLSNGNFQFPVFFENCCFDGAIDLSDCSFTNSLSLYRSELKQGFSADRIRVGGNLNLGAVKISGDASLELVNVTGLLYLHDAPRINKIKLGGAHVGDQLRIVELTCERIETDGLSVGKQAFIVDSAINETDLRGLRIADNLEINGSQFYKNFKLEDAVIDGNFFITQSPFAGAILAEFDSLQIQNSHIKGRLGIRGVRLSEDSGTINVDETEIDGAVNFEDLRLDQNVAISGKVGSLYINGCQLSGFYMGGTICREGIAILNSGFGNVVAMPGVIVDGDVVVSAVTFKQGVNFSFARLKANVDFDAVEFDDFLDLSGARIEGLLAFASQTVRSTWAPDAALHLTDAFVHSLEDRMDAWPSTIYLDGFTYNWWGGYDLAVIATNPNSPNLAVTQNTDFSERPIEWFTKEWIKKQPVSTPGPYRQLATIFQGEGMQDKAVSVLYAGKDAERHHAPDLFTKAFLTLSYLLIGYGYHYERSLWWCLGFVVLGTIVVNLSGESRGFKGIVGHGFFYSLSAFLPFIELRKKFEEIDYERWAKYYFYIHRLAGYIIGSFIIAGLSGITK